MRASALRGQTQGIGPKGSGQRDRAKGIGPNGSSPRDRAQGIGPKGSGPRDRAQGIGPKDQASGNFAMTFTLGPRAAAAVLFAAVSAGLAPLLIGTVGAQT